jgi:HSP20 family protein
MATPNESTQTQPSTQPGRSGNGGGQSSQVQARESGRQEQRGRAVARSPARGELSPFMSHPFELMRQLSREMDRMMSSFGAPFFGGGSRWLRGWDEDWATPTMWVPRIDVEQRGDSIVVRADLPGVRKEDVQIEATDEGIVLCGERREEREEGGESQGYRSIERSYGSFYRTIPLGQKAKLDQLKAKMRDGVLEITVPLDESARPRKIKIED